MNFNLREFFDARRNYIIVLFYYFYTIKTYLFEYPACEWCSCGFWADRRNIHRRVSSGWLLVCWGCYHRGYGRHDLRRVLQDPRWFHPRSHSAPRLQNTSHPLATSSRHMIILIYSRLRSRSLIRMFLFAFRQVIRARFRDIINDTLPFQIQ